MPIYTYQCENCGVRFDARQKFSDEPIVECLECGGHVHRVPQPVGIVFKGSGWYAKDSRSTNNLATPGKKDADSGDTTAAKSEAKPDAAASTDKSDKAPSSGSETKSSSPPKAD